MRMILKVKSRDADVGRNQKAPGGAWPPERLRLIAATSYARLAAYRRAGRSLPGQSQHGRGYSAG